MSALLPRRVALLLGRPDHVVERRRGDAEAPGGLRDELTGLFVRDRGAESAIQEPVNPEVRLDIRVAHQHDQVVPRDLPESLLARPESADFLGAPACDTRVEVVTGPDASFVELLSDARDDLVLAPR